MPDIRVPEWNALEPTVASRWLMRWFPRFLIVGPQRTGTTWLFANLRRHRRLYLPPEKELHFFNRVAQARAHGIPAPRGLDWYLTRFAPWRPDYLKARLAAAGGPLLRGEATASYAAMDESMLDTIVALRPDIKVVLMVRDPVQRAWSHAMKDLVRKKRRRSHAEVGEEEFTAFFRDPYQLACSRYSEMVGRWERRLQPGHLFVGDFARLSQEPLAFAGGICDFLGVEPLPADAVDTGRVNSSSQEQPIPAKYREALEALFDGEKRFIRERLGFGA